MGLIGRSDPERGVVVLRPGLDPFLLYYPALTLLFLRNYGWTRSSTAMVAVFAVVVPMHLRRSVRLTPDGIVVCAGFWRRSMPWGEIVEIRIRRILWNRQVYARNASGRPVALPAPTWFLRRAKAEAEFRLIVDTWAAHGGHLPMASDVSGPEPSRQERIWAAIACASVYEPIPIGPLLVLLTQGRRSEFVAAHAKAAINYSICALTALGVSFGLLSLTSSGVALFVLIPVIILAMVMPWVLAAGALSGGPPFWPVRIIR